MSRKPIPAWLSRQRNGLYMLTQHRPALERVGRTDAADLYVVPGDGIGMRHICGWAAERIWGVTLEPLESVQVKTIGEQIKGKDDGV